MPSWSGTWVRTHVEEEDFERPPNDAEIAEKARQFRARWSKLLGIHWGLYFILFFSQIAMSFGSGGFNMTLVMAGFFSLFIHQALFILSGFSMGAIDRFAAKRLGRVRDYRQVRVQRSGQATLTLDSDALSLRLDEGSAKEVSRTPLASEESSPRTQSPLVDVRVPLAEGRFSLDLVQDVDQHAVLEVRDTRSGARIDLTGFVFSAGQEAPVMDRDPVALSSGDAAQLHQELVHLADAHGVQVPAALR